MTISSREKEIKNVIKECEEDSKSNGKPLERRALEIMGEKKILPVYRIPINVLHYNIRNGRFAAELKEKEAELGHTLDSNNPDDDIIIKNILLSQNKEETEILKMDIKAKGQIEPGLITYDGQVINGNRRMAVLVELFSETSNPKYEFLEVQVLPKSVDEKGLWRIEAGLQLSRDKRLDYSPINQLLKLEEGINAGLTPEQIAKTYYGKITKEKIENDLDRLKLIKEYLHYIEKPFQFKYVKGFDNHFQNLQKQIKILKTSGVDETVINNAIMTGYEIIFGRIKHMNVRRLAKVYQSEKAKMYIEKRLEKVESEVSDGDLPTSDEENDDDDDDDDDDDEEALEESLSSDDIEETRKKAKSKKIRESYEYAIEIVKFEEDREKPGLLIDKAYSALDSIDLKSKYFKTKEIRESLVQLASKIEEIIKLIDRKN